MKRKKIPLINDLTMRQVRTALFYLNARPRISSQLIGKCSTPRVSGSTVMKWVHIVERDRLKIGFKKLSRGGKIYYLLPADPPEDYTPPQEPEDAPDPAPGLTEDATADA